MLSVKSESQPASKPDQLQEFVPGRGLLDLGAVKPPHVAAYVEMLGLPEPDGAGPRRTIGRIKTTIHSEVQVPFPRTRIRT